MKFRLGLIAIGSAAIGLFALEAFAPAKVIIMSHRAVAECGAGNVASVNTSGYLCKAAGPIN